MNVFHCKLWLFDHEEQYYNCHEYKITIVMSTRLQLSWVQDYNYHEYKSQNNKYIDKKGTEGAI